MVGVPSAWLLVATLLGVWENAERLSLRLRVSADLSPGCELYQTVERLVEWRSDETAIIVCDMWDRHWCRGATRRVAEMAPRMNEVLREARERGVLIVHAPSGTLGFYEGTPQRRRAQEAPAATPPVPLQGWCSLDPEKEAPLPIDDSNGGCDCEPRCAGGSPWTRQIETLEIAETDAISDSGAEVYNLLEAHGIEHVLVMGVHTNMCVLGRPFSIRQLVGLGKDVALVRDLTDTMYDSRSRPWVSHFRGTDLVVQHIEKFWCPTITSADLTGAEPFRFSRDRRPRIAFVLAEDEYDAKTTVPAFAQRELCFRFGIPCDFIVSDSKTDVPGLERLADADLAVLYVRRRTLPEEQLQHVRDYLATGRPLVALRTSSHAFQNWLEFDPEVLGGHYHGHHGANAPATMVSVLPDAAGHPVVAGLPEAEWEFPVTSWLYKILPLEETTTPLLIGRVGDLEPHEPVAWVNDHQGARVFYTSLGHPDDFELDPFRRLLLNGIFWSLDLPAPRHAPLAADEHSDG